VSPLNISDARRGAAIAVKVMPRARKTEVAGVMDDGTIKIRVAAPPAEGAANTALIAFLAETLGIARSQIDIVAGLSSERKLISLVGISPDQVDATIQRLLPGAKPAEAHDAHPARKKKTSK
jgi:uncharacterized protein (TIGR00251 family)